MNLILNYEMDVLISLSILYYQKYLKLIDYFTKELFFLLQEIYNSDNSFIFNLSHHSID